MPKNRMHLAKCFGTDPRPRQAIEKSEAQRKGEAIHAEVERHLKERGDGRNVYRERALYKQAAEKFAAAIDRASQLAPKILKDDLLRAFVEGGVEATCRAVESEKGKR